MIPLPFCDRRSRIDKLTWPAEQQTPNYFVQFCIALSSPVKKLRFRGGDRLHLAFLHTALSTYLSTYTHFSAKVTSASLQR